MQTWSFSQNRPESCDLGDDGGSRRPQQLTITRGFSKGQLVVIWPTLAAIAVSFSSCFYLAGLLACRLQLDWAAASRMGLV